MGHFRQPQIGKPPYNPGRRRPLGRLERRALWDRLAKKFLKQRGIIPAKQPSVWVWTCGARSGFVSAFTRSEARARAKEALGFRKKDRLPTNVTIEKIENDKTGISIDETGVSAESNS